MNGMKRMSVAAVAALAMGTVASADTTLQLDLNSLLTTVSVGTWSNNFTGTLTITDDANSSLNDVLINGTTANPLSNALVDVLGSITIVNNMVTGGSFSIEVDNTAGVNSFYSAYIVSGSGWVVPQAGQGWSIDGLTFAGNFTDTAFGGSDVFQFADVDVTPWTNEQPLRGSFINFAFDPGSVGYDENSNMDVFVVIPLPSTAGLGLLGLATIGAQRRRR